MSVSVLFVCLGNICRSPLAEGVLEHLVKEAGLESEWRIESAGTGAWHVGEPADPRARAVAARRGITLTGAARQFAPSDFVDFDYIIAMDRENLRNIEALKRTSGRAAAEGASIHLLRDFDPRTDDGDEVPDPYYGGDGGFERVYEIVHRSCESFLETVAGR